MSKKEEGKKIGDLSNVMIIKLTRNKVSIVIQPDSDKPIPQPWKNLDNFLWNTLFIIV